MKKIIVLSTLFLLSTTVSAEDIYAGKINDAAEAGNICPGVCHLKSLTWNGNWTKKHHTSVCGCDPATTMPGMGGGMGPQQIVEPVNKPGMGGGMGPQQYVEPVKHSENVLSGLNIFDTKAVAKYVCPQVCRRERKSWDNTFRSNRRQTKTFCGCH